MSTVFEQSTIRQAVEPGVTVIVCAYTHERWPDLIAAIDSLHAQTLKPEQIILVIDHNEALFSQAQARFAAQGVVVMENSEPRGLSGARNTGLKLNQSPIIAFMDEDAVAEPDWLARLVAAYDDPQVMGVGGAIVPHWADGRPGWFPPPFDWVVGCTYEGMPTGRAAVRNLIGCNMSFRRELAEQNGGFRHGIGRIGTRPVGCEETEYCIRAHQRWPEGRFIYEPEARVRHTVPAKRATWAYFQSRCYAEGLSKAAIGQFVGAKSSLSSETSYVARTLPLAVLRNLGAALRFDLNGLAQAAAIVAGLGLTGAGYLTTRVRLALQRRMPAPVAAAQTHAGQL